MSKAAKIAAIFVASAAVMLMGSGVLLAWTVATQGLVHIDIDDRESGTRINLPVPAAMVGAGISLVPWAARHHRCEHEGCEHRAALRAAGPALAAFFAALEDAPDAVLVEVEDGADHVRIVKSGRDFEVLVESPDADVRLSVPAHLLQRIARAAV